MMNLFHRRELMTVFSMQRLYALQDTLDTAGIAYHTKTMSPARCAGGRLRGNPFQNPDAAYEFKIFVHRDDYDRALAAIQPVLQRN